MFTSTKTKYASIFLATFIILLSGIVITSNSNSFQSALAQQQPQNSTTATTNNTTTSNQTNATANQIDTFRAKGQISSVASDLLAGRTNASSNSNEMWVLGGDWEFNVANSNLTNFVSDIVMTKIDGTGAHRHTIEKLDNVSGMSMTGGSQLNNMSSMMNTNTHHKITLQGNSTMFVGKADITTNGNIKWKDVTVHVALINGNILNINIDPVKTEDHFKGLPVFGTVQFIIDKNGKNLINQNQTQ